LTKNRKLQFSPRFGRSCTQTRHFAREKLGATTGTRTEKAQSSTPFADTELKKSAAKEFKIIS